MSSTKNDLQGISHGAGEMAALLKDPSFIPSTYMVPSNHGACNSGSRGSDAPFWHLWALHSHCLNIHTLKKTILSSLRSPYLSPSCFLSSPLSHSPSTEPENICLRKFCLEVKLILALILTTSSKENAMSEVLEEAEEVAHW